MRSRHGRRTSSRRCLSTRTEIAQGLANCRALGGLIDAFDHFLLAEPRTKAVALRPWPVRQTLRGMLFARLEGIIEVRAAA